MAQNFWTAIFAFWVNFIVTVVVSYCTKARPEAELVGLVHSLTPKPESAKLVWWKRPEALAAAILLAVIALNMFALAGAILTAFGLKSNGNVALYAKSLGINVNLWWGLVMAVFGLTMFWFGQRGQMRAEKERDGKRKKAAS